jgi:hypothetical protein
MQRYNMPRLFLSKTNPTPEIEIIYKNISFEKTGMIFYIVMKT